MINLTNADVIRIREEYFKQLSTPNYPARAIKRVEVEAIEDFCQFLIEQLACVD